MRCQPPRRVPRRHLQPPPMEIRCQDADCGGSHVRRQQLPVAEDIGTGTPEQCRQDSGPGAVQLPGPKEHTVPPRRLKGMQAHRASVTSQKERGPLSWRNRTPMGWNSDRRPGRNVVARPGRLGTRGGAPAARPPSTNGGFTRNRSNRPKVQWLIPAGRCPTSSHVGLCRHAPGQQHRMPQQQAEEQRPGDAAQMAHVPTRRSAWQHATEGRHACPSPAISAQVQKAQPTPIVTAGGLTEAFSSVAETFA